MNSGASLPWRNIWFAIYSQQAPCGSQAFVALSNFVFMSLDFNSGKRGKMGWLDPELQLDCKVLEQKEARTKASAWRKGILKITRLDRPRQVQRVSQAPGKQREVQTAHSALVKPSDASQTHPCPQTMALSLALEIFSSDLPCFANTISPLVRMTCLCLRNAVFPYI